MFDPLNGAKPTTPNAGAIYVGRISPEKGVLGLVEAWRDIDYPLTIVGDGPQLAEARKLGGCRVRFLGNRPHEEVPRLIEQSAFLVFPSGWYEGFGLTLIEAMAVGRAVVATDLGSRREIVRDGQTGILYRNGDIRDLTSKVRRLVSDRNLCARMGSEARKVYLAEYTPDKNYETLIRIYEEAVNRSRQRARENPAAPPCCSYEERGPGAELPVV
jgi:glycosyltransferase involved in cell wall biosynthesis